jgi:hypothetical protein
MACPMCGHDASTTLPLPVEPLYDGETAAMLVPMSLDGFRRLLQRHRDQLPAPYYRYWRGRRYRFPYRAGDQVRPRDRLPSSP